MSPTLLQRCQDQINAEDLTAHSGQILSVIGK